MPEKEDVMKGIILAAVIIAVCRAVKILMRRELKNQGIQMTIILRGQ